MRGNRQWLWLVVLLLGIAAMMIPRLDMDGLWYDELFSVLNAGGAQGGPLSPAELYTRVITEDPYQALGYPWALAIWGAFTGWTEIATRLFSLLAGLLAIAVTARLGREVLNPAGGVIAGIIMGMSSFVLFYTHETRAFTLVALCAACFLWSYHRLVQNRKHGKRLIEVAFVVSAVSLLYAHYAAAFLLVGTALAHLLLVKKNRHWWRVVGLAILSAILFVPLVAAFLEGFSRYDPGNVQDAPMTMAEIITSLLYYLSNDMSGAAVVLLLAGGVLAVRNPRLRLLVVIQVLSTGLFLVVVDWLAILEPIRLRYAIFLFPGLAVWCAGGMLALIQGASQWLTSIQQHQLAGQVARGLLVLLTALWLINGVVVSLNPDFTASIQGVDEPRMRTLIDILKTNETAGDVYVFDNGTSQQAWYIRLNLEYATYELSLPLFFTAVLFEESPENQAWARGHLEAANRVWYGVNHTIDGNPYAEAFVALIEPAFEHCRTYSDDGELSLNLYVRSEAYCPPGENRLQFGEAFALAGYEQVQQDDTLILHTGWTVAPEVIPEQYHLAVHITAQNAIEPLAQLDVSLPVDAFSTKRLRLETGDLPAGTYDVNLIVYDWQTRTRLPGLNPGTGERGERMVTGTVTITE